MSIGILEENHRRRWSGNLGDLGLKALDERGNLIRTRVSDKAYVTFYGDPNLAANKAIKTTGKAAVIKSNALQEKTPIYSRRLSTTSSSKRFCTCSDTI
jgi:hypothetical protein